MTTAHQVVTQVKAYDVSAAVNHGNSVSRGTQGALVISHYDIKAAANTSDGVPIDEDDRVFIVRQTGQAC